MLSLITCNLLKFLSPKQWLIVGITIGLVFMYSLGFYKGYNYAVSDYYEETVKVLKKDLQETTQKKDETINYLLSERDSLRASLDESIGRLQYATDLANRKATNNNPTGITRGSLEECRKFNVEGARLLRETLEEYKRESDRVNAINKLIQ